MKKNKFILVAVIAALIILVQPKVFNRVISVFSSQSIAVQLGIESGEQQNSLEDNSDRNDKDIISFLKKQKFDGTNQVILVNNNIPTFKKEDLDVSKKSFWENYSNLDFLNRVGSANALLSPETMPTEERESISNIRPTGWANKKIIFNGKEDYLYNRCQLIGFQLSGENANIKNLFTGTRSLNANFENEKQSMVYYENLVAEYIKRTQNHVRYEVTPVFKGMELGCRGVRMQAQSIEDQEISFDIYVFNVQEGYTIDYLTGKSIKQ